MRQDDASHKYDEDWHRKVDRALFGHLDLDTNIWVDGLLQSLADSRKNERVAIRVGLPLLGVIAVGVVLTALHAPPSVVNAIIHLLTH